MKLPLVLRLLGEVLIGFALAALIIYAYLVSEIPPEFVYEGF